MINELVNKIKSLIRFGRIEQAGSDDNDFPVQAVSYFGKKINCNIIFPYGVHANLPVDSLITMFSVGGDDANKVGLGGMPANRIKNLPEGEVVFFHPITKSKMHFRNNGDIDIETPGNINVNCVAAVIEAEVSIDITSPITTFNGIVVVNGALNATSGLLVSGLAIIGGDLAISGDLTNAGVNIGSTHVHSVTWTDEAGTADTTAPT